MEGVPIYMMYSSFYESTYMIISRTLTNSWIANLAFLPWQLYAYPSQLMEIVLVVY